MILQNYNQQTCSSASESVNFDSPSLNGLSYGDKVKIVIKNEVAHVLGV